MKTLLAILSHSGANETVARHWPWFKKAECDILGVGRENTVCIWPCAAGEDLGNGAKFIGSVNIGKESGPSGDNHIRRFLDVLTMFVSMGDYSHIIITEYDSLFFRPPPEHPGWFVAKVAGYKTPGFNGRRFFHTPWYLNYPSAVSVIGYGETMLRAGLIEHGYIDRFLGLMVDLYPVEWHDTGNTTYTQNTIHKPEHIQEVRDMVKRGGWFCHGVKSPEVLAAITEGL